MKSFEYTIKATVFADDKEEANTLLEDNLLMDDHERIGYEVDRRVIEKDLCSNCGNPIYKSWPGHTFKYCQDCCPHDEWFPYAGTGYDHCKGCGGSF